MEVDAYDLMDAVDILAKLPKDFYDKTVRKMFHLNNIAIKIVFDVV